MGQLSKFCSYNMPSPTMCSLSATAARAEAEAIGARLAQLSAKMGIQEPSLAAARQNMHLDMNTGGPGPGFVPPPSQMLTNEQIEWLMRVGQGGQNARAPAFVAPTPPPQAANNEQVELFLTALCQAQNAVQLQQLQQLQQMQLQQQTQQPCSIPEPPGLESGGVPSPERIPVPKRFAEVNAQQRMMWPDMGPCRRPKAKGFTKQSPNGKTIVNLDHALGLSDPGTDLVAHNSLHSGVSHSGILSPSGSNFSSGSPSGSDHSYPDTESYANIWEANLSEQRGNSSPKKGDCRRADTMKAQLQALQLEDPASIFIARGINKLGFDSPDILKAHFSRYGKVKGVYVSHSRVKSMRHGGGEPRSTDVYWRLRAAPTGFVVMSSPEATNRILAEGPEQDVNGFAVRLQTFHNHTSVKEASLSSEDPWDSPSSSQSPSRKNTESGMMTRFARQPAC